MGTHFGLQCPAGTRSTRWYRVLGREMGRETWGHHLRPVAGCAVSTGKRRPSLVFLPPSHPHFSLETSRADPGNSELPRVAWTPVPILSGQPGPPSYSVPHSPPRPWPETLGSGCSSEGVDARVGTLITTTPRPTKAPTGKPPYTHHRQSPSLQGKLFIRPRFGASLWTAEAATAAVRRAPELLALFLPPPSLGRLSPPPPSLLPPPPPFLPSRGPRTHPEPPSALGYSHCGLTQPTWHGCQSGAGCVCGVQGRRPNGAGGGMVEPLSFQPRPPAHSPSLILGCQQQ